MDKLLRIEVALLLLLVVASVFVRMGITGQAAQPSEPEQLQSQPQTDPVITQTQPAEPEATEPEETEPPIKLTFAEDFTLEARDYFVYECSKDNLMAVSGSLDEKVYPASVTKLFTAYVALQYLQPETVLTLGREVYMVPSDSSLAYLKNGQQISVSHLVEGMLLPSGNDAAYALAVAAARVHAGQPAMECSEALAYFVDMMNSTARDVGMTGSNFVNPDGYHDWDHYVSLGDLIIIGTLALENELIMQCAATVYDEVRFSNGDLAKWSNTNALIDPQSQYYHADAVGLKTGHTSAAGFCVLTAFELEGEYILVGTFGCVRPEDRFIDALKLYELAREAILQ